MPQLKIYQNIKSEREKLKRKIVKQLTIIEEFRNARRKEAFKKKLVLRVWVCRGQFEQRGHACCAAGLSAQETLKLRLFLGVWVCRGLVLQGPNRTKGSSMLCRWVFGIQLISKGIGKEIQ